MVELIIRSISVQLSSSEDFVLKKDHYVYVTPLQNNYIIVFMKLMLSFFNTTEQFE